MVVFTGTSGGEALGLEPAGDEALFPSFSLRFDLVNSAVLDDVVAVVVTVVAVFSAVLDVAGISCISFSGLKMNQN